VSSNLKLVFTPILLLSLITACGFQLRGSADIPEEWLALHLLTNSPNSELAKSVRSSFSNNGVQWLDAGDANYVLELGNERFEQRNLTIGGNARAAEFELTLTASMEIRDQKGKVVLPAREVSVQKIMTNDPRNVTGKVEETNLLQREMRQELVQQMMRNIRFAASTGVANTD
jgi:LPS-assembly lipoprotein